MPKPRSISTRRFAPIDTAIELARTRDVDAPLDVAGMRAALVARCPGAISGAPARVRPADHPDRQDVRALERITAELIETKAAENVRYVEIRWGPLLHVARGLSLADGIAAVTRAAGTPPLGPARRFASSARRSDRRTGGDSSWPRPWSGSATAG